MISANTVSSILRLIDHNDVTGWTEDIPGIAYHIDLVESEINGADTIRLFYERQHGRLAIGTDKGTIGLVKSVSTYVDIPFLENRVMSKRQWNDGKLHFGLPYSSEMSVPIKNSDNAPIYCRVV